MSVARLLPVPSLLFTRWDRPSPGCPQPLPYLAQAVTLRRPSSRPVLPRPFRAGWNAQVGTAHTYHSPARPSPSVARVCVCSSLDRTDRHSLVAHSRWSFLLSHCRQDSKFLPCCCLCYKGCLELVCVVDERRSVYVRIFLFSILCIGGKGKQFAVPVLPLGTVQRAETSMAAVCRCSCLQCHAPTSSSGHGFQGLSRKLLGTY